MKNCLEQSLKGCEGKFIFNQGAHSENIGDEEESQALAARGCDNFIGSVAAVHGPFHIAAAGGDYVKFTFKDDEEVEYEGAGKLLDVYLGVLLKDPINRAKVLGTDYLRVVYYDGQIYDYLIQAYPSSVPLTKPKKMATASAVHLAPEWERIQRDCNMGRSYHKVVTVNTGYWGVTEVRYPDRDEISSSWVSTGTRDYDFDDCGGK